MQGHFMQWGSACMQAVGQGGDVRSTEQGPRGHDKAEPMMQVRVHLHR